MPRAFEYVLIELRLDPVEARTARGIQPHPRGGAIDRGRRVERTAGQAVDGEHIQMRLEVRGQRPQHLAVVADVDITVHRDHGFQVRVPAEQGQHDLPRLAVAALIQRHVAVKMRAGIRVMHGGDGGETCLQFLAHFRFARQAREGQMLGVAAAHDVDQPGVLAPQQGVDAQHVVGRAIRGVTAEFAERAFLGVGRRVDGAFQHKLGVRRHTDAVARGFHQLQRCAEQTASDGTLIAAIGQARSGGEHEQRMRTDHHRHAQFFATLAGGLQHPPQVPA